MGQKPKRFLANKKKAEGLRLSRSANNNDGLSKIIVVPSNPAQTPAPRPTSRSNATDIATCLDAFFDVLRDKNPLGLSETSAK